MSAEGEREREMNSLQAAVALSAQRANCPPEISSLEPCDLLFLIKELSVRLWLVQLKGRRARQISRQTS